MKYFLAAVISSVLLLGCSKSNSTMELSGEVFGLKKGTLFLQKIKDSSFVTIDSMKVDGDANFHFSANMESPEVFYLTMQFQDSLKTQKRVPFFAEAGEITLTSKLKNFEIESKVSGSENHQKWEEYQALMKRYNNKKLEVIEAYYNALKDGNDSLSQSIAKQQEKLISSSYLATINFAKNHNDLEIAPYLMITEVADANPKFQDTIYNLLAQKVKDSKYGKQMESFIKNRKEN